MKNSGYLLIHFNFQEEDMKRFIVLALVCAVGFSFASCKKNEFAGFKYNSFTPGEEPGSFLAVQVLDKNGKQACWFHMLDQVGQDNSSYTNSTDKVGKYPASISPNNHVWILVNNRFEIRLVADSDSEVFKNTEMLKKFLMAFDLAGLEAIQGEKVSPKVMAKYIPQLGQ